MNRIYITFPKGKTKCLTMSYDDGKLQDKKLIEIFDANGIKGTFNLNSGLLDKPAPQNGYSRIPSSEIMEVYRDHEVAAHTYSHPTLERCPLSEVAWEIMEDRKKLEEITGRLVRGNAYPNGSYSEEIKVLFRQLGIDYARVVEAVPDFKLPRDPYEWHPTAHHNDPKLMDKAEFFVGFNKKQYLKLMYIWGHSYEFDKDDNWEVMERFCKYAGRREDIWYATNIEFIDYMNAAKSLKFSADNSFVYNPGASVVCLEAEGKYVEAVGGETTKLTF
ncbi:MAG: polysaccharide deacetylase family protein [Lachnospiraceae bacterium]|nr:polysaccharide deacetylase family protein [Lachnospiraceae bacterium]